MIPMWNFGGLVSLGVVIHVRRAKKTDEGLIRIFGEANGQR